MTEELKLALQPFLEAYQDIAGASLWATPEAGVYLPEDYPLVMLRYAKEDDEEEGEPIASVTMGQLRALVRAAGEKVTL